MFSYVEAESCVLNLGEFISVQFKEIYVYVCGLELMIAAVINCCDKHRHWWILHWEQFASTVPEDEDAFTVVFAKSNQFYKRSKH